MADSHGLTDLPFDIYTGAMSIAGVPDAHVTSLLVILSKSCTRFHRLFKPELTKRATKQLWQAMIDDDRKTVAKIASARPDLLLLPMQKGFFIQSKYTHQEFDLEGETLLAAAVKRKQLKMIKLLLTLYDKLEQTEQVITAKRNAMSAWKSYAIQINEENEAVIYIPKDYADYAQSLIDLFKDETFPQGVPGQNDIPRNTPLSEQTELALSHLLNILVPKTAVKLDEYIDVELFLLALYKTLANNFLSFNNNMCKLDSLCIRVIGLTQSALTPEMGEIFSEGLADVMMAINTRKEKVISVAAASHKLKTGVDFYRLSRDSRTGLGFDFLCGVNARNVFRPTDESQWYPIWEELCQAKEQIFGSVILSLQHQQDHHSINGKLSNGVML